MQTGAIIRKYREEKNLTQKEMASRLGVSAPAVNKWENGSSMPDIQLLAPIARLLGITIDTLLSFQEELTDQEISDFSRELDRRLQEDAYEDCFQWAKQKLSQYPDCTSLLWQAAVILDAGKTGQVTDAAQYEADILSWYERALESPSELQRTRAADSLFYFHIRRKDYEKAEQCLAYLSEQNPERKNKKAHLCSLTGRMGEAYQCYEELLFSYYQTANMVLQRLTAFAMQEADLKQAHLLADKQCQLAKLFDMGTYCQVSPYLELALLEKDTHTASSIMEAMLNSVDSLGAYCQSPLFQHMNFQPVNPAFLEKVRKNLEQHFQDPDIFNASDQ